MDQSDVQEIIATAIDGTQPPGRLVTFGESYILLSSNGNDRLEQANSVHLAVGGRELNTAAAYACLDLRASWVSTVSDSVFGRRKLRAARAASIDTRFVTTAIGRSALKFVDAGVHPRDHVAILDATDTAFARYPSGRRDWENILDGAAAFYTSGITLGASPGVRQDAIDAMAVANRRGIIVAFDLSFDSDMWTEAEARRVFSGVVRHADVLFADRENLALFFGIEGSQEEALHTALARLGVAAIASRRERRRGNGRITLEGLGMGGSGVMMTSDRHIVEVVDPSGADDAFAAGFLAGYLRDPGAIRSAVELGAAMSALVQTTPAEMLIATREEIEHLAGLG